MFISHLKFIKKFTIYFENTSDFFFFFHLQGTNTEYCNDMLINCLGHDFSIPPRFLQQGKKIKFNFLLMLAFCLGARKFGKLSSHI